MRQLSIPSCSDRYGRPTFAAPALSELPKTNVGAFTLVDTGCSEGGKASAGEFFLGLTVSEVVEGSGLDSINRVASLIDNLCLTGD